MLPRGLTFYVCFGQYGGWFWHSGYSGFDVHLGWVSVGVMPFNVELLIGNLAERATRHEREL